MHAANRTANRAPAQPLPGSELTTRTTCRQWWSDPYQTGGALVRDRAANDLSTIYHVYARSGAAVVLILTTDDLGAANIAFDDHHQFWYFHSRFKNS